MQCSISGEQCSITQIILYNTYSSCRVVCDSAPSWLPLSMARSVQVLQLLYHMALDSYDKPTAPPAPPCALADDASSAAAAAAGDKVCVCVSVSALLLVSIIVVDTL